MSRRSDLEYELRLVENRAERFRELKESCFREEEPTDSGFELNDFGALNLGLFKIYPGLVIPEDLVIEAGMILRQHGSIRGNPEIRRNPEFLGRCELVERKLYKVLSDYLNTLQ